MKTLPESCFIADDLSGALEVGSLFKDQGQPVRLVINPSSLAPPAGSILGYDLNTRQMTEDRAYGEVRALVTEIRKRHDRLFYKKIDSTLRGWISEEIRAVLDADPDCIVFFCPANPVVGRTVHDGRLLVDGTPVDETPFNRDPAFPITDARIASRFRPGLRELLRHCPLSTVRDSETVRAKWIDQSLREGGRIVSFDAVSETDLVALARAARSLRNPVLLCGSGALAGAIHRVDPGGPAKDRAKDLPPIRPEGNGVGFLIGSAHPRTREQFELLRQERSLEVVDFDPADPPSWSRPLNEFGAKCQRGPVAVVPRVTGPPGRDTSAAIQTFFRRLAGRKEPEPLPDRLFVTGGETARTVIDAIRVDSLDLSGSLEPGVAVALAQRSSAMPGMTNVLTVVTKPGGFGGPDTLVQCYDYLTT